MKKKYLIYLLTLVMILSPAAAFAGAEDGAEGESPDAAVVLDQEAPTEDAVVDQEEPAAEEVAGQNAPADAEDEIVEEDAEAEERLILDTEAGAVNKSLKLAADDGDHWDGDKYVNKDGEAYTGLFKAPKKNGSTGNGLYYAEADGTVKPETRIVTVTEGKKYRYVVTTDGIWDEVTEEGPLSYLVLNDTENNDCSIVAIKGLWGTNKEYYVGDEGIARTEAGPLTYEGKTYFVNEGGLIQKTEAFVQYKGDTYYVDKNSQLCQNEAVFTFGGKTWYRKNKGIVNTAAGVLIPYKGSQYYTNSDGSIKTDAGFITVGSKRYLVQSGGAISKKAGVITYGANKYAANSDGSIITKVGFVTTGGKIYYVKNSSGVLTVNKNIKAGGKQYHATATGALAIGVHKWGKYYYYSNSKGAVRTKKGIVKWAGNRYYVGKKGKITTNKKFKYKKKTYIAKKNGAFRKGIFKWKKNLYYANSKGVVRTKSGVFTYDGSRYCSRKGGKLYKNQLFTSGGKKYLAGSDGKLKAGLLQWKRALYLTDAKCRIFTKAGMYTYGSKQYYVKKGGKIAISQFVKFNDKHYFAGSDGAIMKKSFKYGGIKITPNSKTGEISDEEYWKVFPDEAPKAEPTDQA